MIFGNKTTICVYFLVITCDSEPLTLSAHLENEEHFKMLLEEQSQVILQLNTSNFEKVVDRYMKHFCVCILDWSVHIYRLRQRGNQSLFFFFFFCFFIIIYSN